MNRKIQEMLTLTPSAKGFVPEPSYPIFLVEDGVLRVPRMFGIAQFGVPSKDDRTQGDDIEGSFTGTLYPWQQQVVDYLHDRLQLSPNGGILEADCGLGKTTIAIALALKLKKKIAVAVNKQFLLGQWKDRIEQFTENITVGIVQGTQCSLGDITLVMIQTIVSGKYPRDFFDSIGGLFIDEVHHIPARTYSQLTRYFKAHKLLGLTATIQRGDGNHHAIHWGLGATLCRCGRKSSTTKPRIVRKCTGCGPLVSPERNNRLNWPALISLLVNDKQRNAGMARTVDDLVSQGRFTLVISDRVAHLDTIRSLTTYEDGFNCKYVGESSASKKRARDEEFSAFPRVVWTSKAMASEGFDWKPCDTVLFATPFTAGSNLQQACGRCSRTTDSSRERLIIDPVDRTPVLKQMSTSRFRFLLSKGIILNSSDE